MNKLTKIIVILMLTVIILYVVVGVYKTNENGVDNISSGDVLNSGDDNQFSGDEEINIDYEISSGENEVVLKGTSEGSISTTTYVFENEKLVKITLTEEITSGDDKLIENIYNYMKNDEEMSMVYSSVEREGNIINAELRTEYVDVYDDSTKSEIYQELMNSLEMNENT